jgi:MFS family permease
VSSILFQQVIAGYVFVLTNSNKPVGIVKGIQGIAQLVFSFPAGYFADHTRRDRILRLSAVLGIFAAVLTFIAVSTASMMMVYVVFGLWGAFAAMQSPAMEALFADSIPQGERSFPFMIKYNISNFAQMLGPALCVFLFIYYGDMWQLPQLTPVLEFGTMLAVVSSLLLFRFNDDLAIENRLEQQALDADDEQIERALTHSPLKTPTLVGNELDLEYEYSDEDNKQSAGATEQTALLTQQNAADLEQQKSEQDSARYFAQLDAKFLCFRTPHVPYILFVADFIISNGAGMTINFFPLFFKEEYGLTPIHVCLLFMAQPLVVMVLSVYSQRVSKWCGRMPIIVVTRVLSVVCLYFMSLAQPVGLQIFLFLMRGGMMRCSQPLRRSILMDYVPKDIRARWNALEGLSVFSWSGSAVIGGFLIDAYDYRTCFVITSLVYCVGLALEAVLIPLTKHAVEH